MNAQTILAELKLLGKESYKRVLMRNHGVKEPCFGVPISELKKFQKRIRRDYELALDLYDSGNYDAMYLAGMIADDTRMTKRDLQAWVNRAYAGALPGTTVASVAAGGPHGWDLALEWIESPKPMVASAGWATISAILSVRPDSDLPLDKIKQLIQRVQNQIQKAPDLVRYHMNSFMIAVGCYVESLTDVTLQTAEEIGPVMVDLGDNDCQVPFAPDYIRKVQARASIGKKRKSARC